MNSEMNLNLHTKNRFGSRSGLLLAFAIGFAIYFILAATGNITSLLSYSEIVDNADSNILYKTIWFIMNFTDAEFYAGVFASVLMLAGAFVTWRLGVKGSKLSGFGICYGTNMFPWVLASQIISLGIAILLLSYTSHFGDGQYDWIPTYITVVGVPPAVMLIYGPSLRALVTGSILGGTISFPLAFWFMTNITPTLGVPVVVGNVVTMAITGVIVLQVCHVAPWITKKDYPKYNTVSAENLSEAQKLKRMSSPTWFIRRVFADFTEAQFYGSEIAGACLITGAVLGSIFSGHSAYASGALGAIILSQFAGSAVGVYLYFNKYYTDGWYGTFVPVVSIGPACVLMFGAGIHTALFAGILGGIIGAPMADYFAKKLPQHIHPTVGNVASMACGTVIVAMVMKALPWF